VYQSSIPTDAVEQIESHHANGMKKAASYFVAREKVGYREWDEDGQLEFESAMRNGVRHGHEYRFQGNGRMLSKETYRNGQEHGVGKQWAEDGTLLVTWKLVNGTGLDLWCDTQTGTLAEEPYWPRKGELGYTRLWNGDERTVSQEYFCVLGKGYHGVWREWNAKGKLRRGFPRYYVNDVRVTRRQYLKACKADPTLVPYRAEEDRPGRALPGEYLAQR
jgi:antitoxin component YwqK of YwqJK toxin-antitoxin module